MRVLFVGGGTLGSVTPLLAVAEALKREFEISNLKFEIRFLGTRTGPERTLVEAAGIPFRSIPAGKLRRYWDFRNLLDAFVIVWAFVVALARLIRQRPSVVVGAGSFVQVPVMWAAWLLHIPVIVHQLDVRPSLANRLAAPIARAVTVTFPESAKTFRNATIVGAPVRAAILAARDLDPREAKRHFGFIQHQFPEKTGAGFTGDRPVLLVIGGGTGAQFLNELVRGALPKLIEYADVIHVTGKGKWIPTPPCPPSRSEGGKQEISPPPFGRGSERGWGDHYRSFELLTDDLPSAYAAADLVISRAGMGTIAELAALGKPMVFIPMPGTHQEQNAAALAAAGAAIVWDERELTVSAFTDRVRALLADTHRQATLARAGGACIAPGAADRLAAVVRAAARPLPR